MSERSGGREQSKQSGASERGSGVSEQAKRRASGPVLLSAFLAALDHSETDGWRGEWIGGRIYLFMCA